MDQDKKLQCYMCSNEATSREHVPPLCLFPESKDVHGLNFRKDLITVPSCDEHNSKKTKDDEFLMVAMAGVVGNNYLAYHHTNTKIGRALRRKTGDFLGKVVLRNSKSFTVKTIEGYEFPMVWGTTDNVRLDKCFESIAYGLHFHEFGENFIGEIRILFGFVEYEKENHQTFVKFLRKRFEIENLDVVKGENSKVFTYQFTKTDEHGLRVLKLIFYEGADVFIAFQPAGIEKPYMLEMELLHQGIPVTITLDDEEFDFNVTSRKK